MTLRHVLVVLLIVSAVGVGGYGAWQLASNSQTETALKRARKALISGDAERVRRELKWTLWFHPQQPEVLQLTGLSYLRQKKWADAAAFLDRIPQSSPLHGEAQINLAAALLADRQFEKTETVLQRFLQHTPGSLIANRLLSGLYLVELRQHEATTVLEEFLLYHSDKSISRDDLLLALRDLATAEFHPSLPAECLPTLREALERDSDQATVRSAIGQCLWDAGDLVQAETMLREALRQRPDDVRIRCIVAAFLLEAGRSDDAETALNFSKTSTTASYASEPGSFHYWLIRSRLAEHRGDYAQSLQDLDHAVTLQHEDKETLARRGRLLQRLNQPDAARDVLALSHERARAELDMWNLSRDLGTRTPTTSQCEQVAGLYESLGKPTQAAAWRRLSDDLDN